MLKDLGSGPGEIDTCCPDVGRVCIHGLHMQCLVYGNTAFPALCRVFFISICSMIAVEREEYLVDQKNWKLPQRSFEKKKALPRNSWQDVVYVSDRTVSRWKPAAICRAWIS